MTGEIDPNEIIANVITKTAASPLQKVSMWWKRTYLKVGPINYNVLLSISYDAGTNTEIYYKELAKNLIQFISESGLSNQIRVNDVSSTLSFATKEEAEALRQTKNIDLIVWGEFTSDTLKKDGKNLSELKLNFTYGHPDDPQKIIRSMVALDLSSKLAIKNYWRIFNDNSFEDIKLVTANASYMSVYIIALSLKLFGRIEKSATLFRALYNELARHNDTFKEYLKPHLLNCYELLMFDCIWNKGKYSKGIGYCHSILELFPDNYVAISDLALFEYKTGHESQARQLVSRLNQLYPNKAITLLDSAFFYILQGKYKRAYECYRKVIKIKDAYKQFVSELLLEFLGEEYDNSKEPALLYASGIIAHFFSGNTELARNDLEKFLTASESTKYKHMINHASRILGK